MVQAGELIQTKTFYRKALVALVAFYLLTVLPELANDPLIGGDEGWIMSASAQLAEAGVFGSDLFSGFYGAEEHYFFNLPLHHLVLAAVFKLFGVGLLQARLVSVFFGLATLLLTYALGRRLGGEAFGPGAAALLVVLRLNLAPFTGLTLTDLGATVRYDLIAVPYGLAAVLVLLRRPYAPSAIDVAAAGLLVGLAALTQFIGALFVLPVVAFLLTTYLPKGRRALLAVLFVAIVWAPFLPYFAYIAPHWSDFRGQARAVEQQTDFLSPAFYLRQLEREPDRYALSTGLQETPDSLRDFLRRPSARLALFFVAPLAAAFVLYRGLRGDAAFRLLAFLLIGLAVQLALFESTKRFVYWVAVVPFLCLAIATLIQAILGWRPSQPLRLAAVGLVAALLAVFTLEGLAVALKDVRDVRQAPEIEAVGRQLREVLPEEAVVIGDNRLWPALRDLEYRSLLLLFYFTNPRISRGEATDVFGAMERIDADYILVSPLSREILSRLSPQDSAELGRYLAERGELVTTVADPHYGPIDVILLQQVANLEGGPVSPSPDVTVGRADLGYTAEQ